MSDARLLTATAARFAWLTGDAAGPDGLTVPPGGVDDPGTLRMLADGARRTRARGVEGTFLVVCGFEVVGLCGVKGPPDAEGRAEIGYGIAPARRGRGHGRRAVALLVGRLASLGVTQAMAVTVPGNAASEAVLAANGFAPGPPGAALGGARAWRRGIP